MSSDNVATVDRLFRAVEESEDWESYIATCRRLCDPEVVIRETGPVPYQGEYHGYDGLARHAEAWGATWGDLQSESDRALDAEFHEAGDLVVARFRLRAGSPDGEHTLDIPVVGIYRLRNGRLLEFHMFNGDHAKVTRFLTAVGR